MKQAVCHHVENWKKICVVMMKADQNINVAMLKAEQDILKCSEH